MPSIIKKGTSASQYDLSKRTVILEPDILVVLSNNEFDELMNKYGSFIQPRILSDKNPSGCFIVNEKEANALSQNKEIKKYKDKSAPVEVPEPEME